MLCAFFSNFCNLTTPGASQLQKQNSPFSLFSLSLASLLSVAFSASHLSPIFSQRQREKHVAVELSDMCWPSGPQHLEFLSTVPSKRLQRSVL